MLTFGLNSLSSDSSTTCLNQYWAIINHPNGFLVFISLGISETLSHSTAIFGDWVFYPLVFPMENNSGNSSSPMESYLLSQENLESA